MNVRDLLVTLVRFAVVGEGVDRSEIEGSLGGERLATLFKVAKKHDMAHIVCYALEKLPLSFEDAAWQSFLQEKEQAILRYEMIQADINDICACFDDKGIDYIPLKGAVIRALYPQPWMRTSCDIDILVKECDLQRATDALVKERSYKTDNKKTYHDISLFSPFGMHLELHYNIKENEAKYDELLTQVWDFSEKSTGYKHLQSNEFLALHLTAHMAYHFAGGGCGFRSVLDLWLLQKQLELNGYVLNGFLQSVGLRRFYDIMTELGNYWFGGKPSDNPTLFEAEKYILLGGAYGTKKQGNASGQVKSGGKLKYLWSRLFMDYESLSILYPKIKKYKILTPFCQVARWFGAISKANRITNEVKYTVSVSREETEKTEKLLSDLGL